MEAAVAVIRAVGIGLGSFSVFLGAVFVLIGLASTVFGLPSRDIGVGCCPRCDYDTRGLKRPLCPECGADLRDPGRRGSLRLRRLGDEDRLITWGVGMFLVGALFLVLV